MLLRPVKYGAGCMSAETAERKEDTFRGMQQEARVLVIRVRDDFHGANREVCHLRDNFDRVGTPSRADEDHEAAESCDEPGGGQIFSELAPGDLLVVISSDENSPGHERSRGRELRVCARGSVTALQFDDLSF
jgi:hypothetical protein